MAVTWLVSRRVKNAGIVDVVWAALFALLALLDAVLSTDGDPLRRVVAASMMILWSLRLAFHLGHRVLGDLEHEEPRYAELRRSWGAGAERRMFGFFLLQGLTCALLSVPVLIACANPRRGLAAVEIAGLILWMIAVAGETTADHQLKKFRADPANRGHVCKRGLWRYSRHPNYFFEWLIWVAFFLFALGSPRGWLAAYCPLLMFWFLYEVTGIPATEAHSVATKGEEYLAYQRTTSAFVPLPPRR